MRAGPASELGYIIEKNLLFGGKSIRKEKGTVKEKNRAKGKETKGGLLEKMGFCRSGLYPLR